MNPNLVFQLFALLFGLCIGSFLNVCIARMPHDKSVVSPGSACPSCMTPIRAWDNIPVVSWLLLRAQCRNCKVAISSLYPIVELLMGLLALLIFRLMVPDIQQITHYSLGIWCSTTAFVAMLVGLSFIDIRWKMIPDQFSIWAIPFGIGSAFALQYLEGSAPFIGPTPKEAIIGAVAGIGSLLLIIGSYWLIRREEGMGMGDVKLLGMIGAFLGWQALAPVILMASVSGSIIGIGLMMAQGRGFRSQLPFGPFLSLGALAYLFFWPTIQGSLLVG
jgi:leader peptidase (prepilin peptidase)/N-methyltransferase